MKRTVRLALWAVALVSLMSALTLLGCRWSAEWQDRAVQAVMSDEDVAVLAEASGISAAEWRQLLAPAEGYLTRPEADAALPLALVENRDRTGILPIEGFDPDSYAGPVVKAFYLYTKEYGRMAYLDDAWRIEDLLFRAATDRGLRLLILTPLCDAEGTLVTDPEVYRDCLEGLEARLEARGYTFGEGFSCMSFSTPLSAQVLTALAGLLPLLLGCLLICRLLPRLNRRLPLLCLAAAVLYLAAWLAAPGLTARLLPLAAALVFGCWAGWWLARYAGRQEAAPLWREVLTLPAAVTGWSLFAGLYLAALLSTPEQLLYCAIFTGVKASLLLPMGFGCLLLLWQLRGPLLRTGRRGWLGLAVAAVVLAAAAAVLAMRSGDISGGISRLETAFRSWLEYHLYARPRTKEMLIAVPCIPVLVWACRRKAAPLQLLCGAGVCLEVVSVVNTFCHAVAPLIVSVLRTLLGVAMGLPLGLLAVVVLELLWRGVARIRRKTGA